MFMRICVFLVLLFAFSILVLRHPESKIVNAQDDTPKKRLTISDLNRRYVLIAFGHPVGTECKVIGKVIQISEKPGYFFQFKSSSENEDFQTVPYHLVLGGIPDNDLDGREFAVRIRIEIGVDRLVSKSNKTPVLRACIRILKESGTGEDPKKP